MNALFFDSGPIISLVMSRLAWILPLLKKQFAGAFYITPAVKHELVDRPLTIHRFEFEALEVSKMIRENILTVYTAVPKAKVEQLSELADRSFKVNQKFMDIIQQGEVESAACAIKEQAALVIDERTLRLFIEDCSRMKELLELRFHKTITAETATVKLFASQVKDLSILRSVELAAVAFKLGLLNTYIPDLKNGPGLLLESVLWLLKYNGCAVTELEIQQLKELLLRKKSSSRRLDSL